MKEEYYFQAANSIKGLAMASKKMQTNFEKERQSLFFWLLSLLEHEIKYTNSNIKKYHLDIINMRIGNNSYNNEQLLCHSQRYRSLFVENHDFKKVIEKVIKTFSSIKGYKAEYFDFADYGDTIIRITLNVEDMEER